jgi:hypothetical protein
MLCVSASGCFMPSLIMILRLDMEPETIFGTPEGYIFIWYPSGMTQHESFIRSVFPKYFAREPLLDFEK